MLISKKHRVLFKRIFWVFVPAVLVLVVGVGGLGFYMIHRLSHPARTALYGSPRDFQLILQKPMWYEEKWKNSDGTQAVGWLLLRERPAPVILPEPTAVRAPILLVTDSPELAAPAYSGGRRWDGLG